MGTHQQVDDFFAILRISNPVKGMVGIWEWDSAAWVVFFSTSRLRLWIDQPALWSLTKRTKQKTVVERIFLGYLDSDDWTQKTFFFFCFFGHVKKTKPPAPSRTGDAILDSPTGRDGIIWHTQTGRIQVTTFASSHLFGDGTPLKTNMSPENQWLEDVFPTEIQ